MLAPILLSFTAKIFGGKLKSERGLPISISELRDWMSNERDDGDDNVPSLSQKKLISELVRASSFIVRATVISPSEY